MTAKDLETAVRRRPGMAIVDLTGEISGLSEQALDAVFNEAMSPVPGAVLLNFAEVGYINSTGIALIVGLLARAQASEVRMMASGLGDHFSQIFEITRLSSYIVMFTDEEAAFAGLGPQEGGQQ